MKIFGITMLVALVATIFLSMITSCEEMQTQQRAKEKKAMSEGLPRRVNVYENGELVYKKVMKCNLEYKASFVTFTEVRGGEYLSHKIRPSRKTLIIIEELNSLDDQ